MVELVVFKEFLKGRESHSTFFAEVIVFANPRRIVHTGYQYVTLGDKISEYLQKWTQANR